MILEEIMSGHLKITEELVDHWYSRVSEVLNNTKLSGINTKRFLDILYAVDKKNENEDLKFLIMYYNIKLGRIDEAYKYALKLYRSKSKYENDLPLYITLLEELRGVKQYNFGLSDILLDESDVRFNNISYQNKVRTFIYNKEYEKAESYIKQLYIRSLTQNKDKDKYLERFINIMHDLLEAIRKQKENYILYCLQNNDIEEIEKCLESKDKEAASTKKRLAMCDLLREVLYGLPLGEPTEVPKKHNMFDLIEARDLDKVLKSNSNYDYIITAMAKKIKKTEDETIVNDYKGELSPYLYDTLESVYYCVQNNEFDDADEVIWDYLDTIGKSSWGFYILNILFDFRSSYAELNEDERNLKLAEIYDMLVLVSRSMSDEVEHTLIEKYMGKKEKVHPYSKINKIDIEYNYNIEGIDDIIEGIKNKTINYASYANLEYYTEEDLFKIAIMARENYRLGNNFVGDALIQIADNLANQGYKKTSELSLFIKAIKANKDILEGKQVQTLSDEVKMLLAK